VSRPGPRSRYRVPRRVLVDTRELLLLSARKRVEGVVVWWGRMAAGDVVDVVAAYRPRQVAYRSPQGLSVEVPQEAISDMIVRLPAGVFVATRVHTHGGRAYHSDMDNANLLIAHEGAICIVVPFLRPEADRAARLLDQHAGPPARVVRAVPRRGQQALRGDR
jgi:hypothetical protein